MRWSSYDVCMFPKHHNNIFEERSPTPCDNITFKTSFEATMGRGPTTCNRIGHPPETLTYGDVVIPLVI